ncbi:MAG: autotransporter outer membrane beta-barrel domain-containing protein, partial [Hyphomicrobiales bacterium]
ALPSPETKRKSPSIRPQTVVFLGSSRGAGMMVGADTKTSENTRMGIAVGIGRDWINVSERRGSSITVDSISASLYGSYTKEAWQAMLVGSVAHQMWDTERHILFPDNSIDRTARAEYDAFYWALRGELGYMHLADNGWLIRPSATARWAELHTDGFRETGAGDINLQNNGEVYRSIQTSLGLRASREKQLDNGWMRTFQIKGEWLHQWSDHYQEATFVFEGGGTPTAPTTQTPFQIRSPEESPASAILGLGVSFTNDTGVTGFVTGDAILSPTTFHPSLAAGLKLRF